MKVRKKTKKSKSTCTSTGAANHLPAPVLVDHTYIVSVHGMGTSGEGVGRIDNFTIFIPFALPHEVVECQIQVVKKNYATARLIRVIEPSKERVEPMCDIYGNCGGCQLQHISYHGQLDLKTQKVKDMVERMGHMCPDVVQPTLGPTTPWHYRNKMQMPVGGTIDAIRMGFYATGSHDIVQGTSCHIQREENNQIAQVCYDIACQLEIEPYNETTGTGVLRHIVGRIGHDAWMIILVTATSTLPQVDTWVSMIRKRLPKVTSIVQNYNPKRTNVIMGPTNTLLYGNETIEDTIDNLTFTLSPHSFFQVNPEQTRVLYQTALELADLTGNETVIDAYCGTGTISLLLAKQAKRVIGIEIVEPAIIDARANAKTNGFSNCEFIVGDAADVMPQLYKKGVRPDVIVFDPIRAGCKEPVLLAAVAMQPSRLVYVSCNPASMVRDIAILKEYGYVTKLIQPVDMFPMTSHVETVALLSKLDVDKHIDIQIELDEMDLTSAESKATYKQIQNYVLEKFGFKVSTLYIAQVKRKYGLEVREHYNISKNENQQVLQCPIEKEEAILDALKHFKMMS